MLKDNQADTNPEDSKKANPASDDGTSFEDLVGKEQSADKSSADKVADKSDTPTGEQSDQSKHESETGGQKPADQSGQSSEQEDDNAKGEESQKPSSEEGGDDQLFWGKFKTADDAKKSYDQAQSKIIEQGRELNEFKKKTQENEDFLSTLDKALLKNPNLADQLKSAIAGEMKDGETDESKEDTDEEDIDTKIDKKLAERENRAKIKKDRDEWIAKHPDFEKPELGHKVLDLLEAENLPLTAKTLDIAYHYLTRDEQTKKAKDEAAKKEEVADLERQEASAVGGGEPSPKGKTPQENPFDELVGDSINPNIVRT